MMFALDCFTVLSHSVHERQMLQSCITTGGNAGIGRAFAEAAARHGAHVILACRSMERGTNAAEVSRSISFLFTACLHIWYHTVAFATRSRVFNFVLPHPGKEQCKLVHIDNPAAASWKRATYQGARHTGA
jgi:NAD(P)-dependent dehydrogenase (short-subunit alcohol dehydrogenase family)